MLKIYNVHFDLSITFLHFYLDVFSTEMAGCMACPTRGKANIKLQIANIFFFITNLSFGFEFTKIIL